MPVQVHSYLLNAYFKKIILVLPGFSHRAIGGYKAMFELALRFHQTGHDVTILYQYCMNHRNSLAENIRWIKNYFIGAYRFYKNSYLK